MGVSPQAGHVADAADLVDVDRLIAAYHEEKPDPSNPAERVAFGTSGQRGTSLERTFTESHVLAIRAAAIARSGRSRTAAPRRYA
jgi:phosphoglucomutase